MQTLPRVRTLSVAFAHNVAEPLLGDTLTHFIDKAEHFEWQPGGMRVLTFMPKAHLTAFMLCQELFHAGVPFTCISDPEGGA